MCIGKRTLNMEWAFFELNFETPSGKLLLTKTVQLLTLLLISVMRAGRWSCVWWHSSVCQTTAASQSHQRREVSSSAPPHSLECPTSHSRSSVLTKLRSNQESDFLNQSTDNLDRFFSFWPGFFSLDQVEKAFTVYPKLILISNDFPLSILR